MAVPHDAPIRRAGMHEASILGQNRRFGAALSFGDKMVVFEARPYFSGQGRHLWFRDWTRLNAMEAADWPPVRLRWSLLEVHMRVATHELDFRD